MESGLSTYGRLYDDSLLKPHPFSPDGIRFALALSPPDRIRLALALSCIVGLRRLTPTLTIKMSLGPSSNLVGLSRQKKPTKSTKTFFVLVHKKYEKKITTRQDALHLTRSPLLDTQMCPIFYVALPPNTRLYWSL